MKYVEGKSYENQYRFILQTGLRTGELIGLKWEDIDFESKTIQIRRSMEYRYSVKEWRIGEPKSKSGYRTIPLTEEAVAILNKQKEKNKWISEIPTEWEEFVFLCRKRTPVKNTSNVIGHSNIGITMNLYVPTTEEEKKKEIDLVAEALMAI